MRKKQGEQSGFSLIEVLIAMFVFIVGMMAIASMQTESIRHNSRSNTRSVSVFLAQGVLDQILSFDENNAIFDASIANMVWDLDPDSAATALNIAGGGRYSASWSVNTNDPVNNLARVTVTVTLSNDPVRRISLTGFKRFL